tara:strand:+ start:10579 stop:10803 length:225 start_codon:yes stop_codon:yes gene_type:complete
MVMTEEQIVKLRDIWQHCKTGMAKNKEAKAQLIELFNEIHGTNYKTNSNCSSCLNTVYRGFVNIIRKLDAEENS